MRDLPPPDKEASVHPAEQVNCHPTSLAHQGEEPSHTQEGKEMPIAQPSGNILLYAGWPSDDIGYLACPIGQYGRQLLDDELH